MVNNNILIVDISEEFVTLNFNGDTYISEISATSFIGNTTEATKILSQEIKNKAAQAKEVIFTLPICYLNHQIVTLPDNVNHKEQMVFLGLELNRGLMGKQFNIKKLTVTKRNDNGQELCDHLLTAAKPQVLSKLESFAKVLGITIKAVIPSLYLLDVDNINELRASVWAGESKTEIVIWGKNEALSLGSIPNSGDQIGDINRFIINYFDHVDNLNLSMVYLFGPRMKDSAFGFGLTYPHQILENPAKYLQDHLHRAVEFTALDVTKTQNIPRPPLALTPRNLVFLGSAVAVALMVFLTGFNQAYNLRNRSELNKLREQVIKVKKLNNQYQQLEKEKIQLTTEKNFYLDITRRRTPWELIFNDISALTPKDLWFERVNGSKNKIIILGKAKNIDDVSALSINLNANSKYLENVLILGTRDYDEDGNTYNEFQMSCKLKSPTGQLLSTSN